jgi:DNA polymerase-4
VALQPGRLRLVSQTRREDEGVSRSQVRRPRGPVHLGDNDAGCVILHVDMDAFYASVELLERPDLVGTPVVVGASTGNRGVVLSATYEARSLGVHSAMPISRARRLVPQATFLPPQHSRYAEASRAVMDIFGSITPIVEPLSLDEAFLDISGALRRLGRPTAIAALIRARVRDEVGITCSVGVASTKFVAKLASTHCKPDGLLLVPVDKVIDFLHPLPVGALWGVGEKTEEHLTRLGLQTVGDIAATPIPTLERALGPAQGRHLHNLSWGNDPRAVIPDETEKSIGNEETFDSDTDDHEWIRSRIAGLADQVARRMRHGGLVGRTVGLKVRFADFTTITRSRTLDIPTDVGADIYATAWGLFSALGLQRARIRLVGVRMETLTEADSTPTQMLLGAPDHGRREAEVAMDRLRQRYGPDAVRPGRSLEPS